MSNSSDRQSSANQRRTVTYRGQVQGVGFRYTTQRIAAGHAVSGFVQNLSDGRVLLTCEGTAAELDLFVQTIAETMDRYITDTQTTTGPATGEFEGFTVRK